MAKPPSWNDIRSNALAFSARWHEERRENAEAQTFWNEFLAIFGVDRRRVASFEARARRSSTGGAGRIDLLWPGVLVCEHKSAQRDLAAAEQQALDYLDSLEASELPGVILTSDFARIRMLDLGAAAEPVEIELARLGSEIDRFGFIAGYRPRNFSPDAEAAANIEAARLMARLYEQLSKNGYEGHHASVLLTRLLFILFGDDTAMWEKGLLAEFLQTRTQADGSDLGPQLAMLFQVMDKHETKRPPALDDLVKRFPFVNGGLFAERIDIPVFDREMRDELLRCSAFDWRLISPAIFGSMFQAVKSKESRRELGEHYTTEENILKVIKPLFLDELRRAFDSSQNSVLKLRRLRVRLGAFRFLDPACGCGNFLVVAYREMRQLELDIILRLQHLTNETQLTLDATLGLQVSLASFHGIELEEWPARIAETAMFLVDHQANLALAQQVGQAPDRLPIEVSADIHIGNALSINWGQVVPAGDDVVVMGNPPFLRSRMQSESQREDQDRVWAGNKRRGTLDFVTNWFKVASEYLDGTLGRAAFVSTNSICQGEQPAVLWQELEERGMAIDFAHRTFAWSSEAPGAAAVHVVVVGFSRRPKPATRPLFHYSTPRGSGVEATASNINPYLVDGPNVVVGSRQRPLAPSTPLMLFGSMPRDGGHLSKISSSVAADIREKDPIAARYLRRLIGADEMLNGGERWCFWLVGANPADVQGSPVLRERLERVRDMRRASKAKSTSDAAATPGLFVQRAQPSEPYLAVPRVSSESRPYLPTAFYPPEVIASDALMTISGAELSLFGVMSSRVFTAWNRAISGRLKSDCRVSQEITYNNFPWLPPGHAFAEAVTGAARVVLNTRDSLGHVALGTLYHPLAMPETLVAAHRELDRVVLRACGLTARAGEAEIVAVLLDRYREMHGRDIDQLHTLTVN